MLSLQSLMVELDSVLWEVSEPAVALAKLGWWQNELQPSTRQHSQHPAIQAAHRSGLFQRAGEPELEHLIVNTGRLARGESISERSTLIEHCRALGSSEVRLLAAVDGTRITSECTEALGTAMVLMRFTERLDSALPGECWWVPLNDQARFGLAFAEMRRTDAETSKAEFRHALAEEIVGQMASVDANRVAHDRLLGPVLAVLTAVLGRRGRRLLNRPMNQRARPSLGEVWTAWRAATGR